jgi:hypothetical protein
MPLSSIDIVSLKGSFANGDCLEFWNSGTGLAVGSQLASLGLQESGVCIGQALDFCRYLGFPRSKSLSVMKCVVVTFRALTWY